jgi:hypothetical protein
MAERKPLFMTTEGFWEEMATSDSITLGGLSMGGDITMNSNQLSGLGAADASGEALVYGQASANLADLTLASNGDLNLSGGGEVLGLPTTPSGSTAATSKAYVDGLVSGIGWKEPVVTMGLKGNDTVANINGLSPAAGDAYVLTDAGTLTAGSLAVVAGDMVEYSGTAWIKIVSASGGFVPAGTRAVLAEGTIQSPYTDATDNDKIMEFSGSSNTGTDTGDAVNKASVLVQDDGHVGYWDNVAFVYEGTVPSGTWIQFTGAGAINAGDGLSYNGNTLNVNAGDGVEIATDRVALDLAAAGSGTGGLQLTGTTPNKELEVKAGDGILLDSNGVGVDIADTTPGLQLTGSSPNKELAVLVNTAAGLDVTASGIEVDLAAAGAGTGGLEFDGSGDLQVKVNGSEGIILGSNGLAIEIDDTPDTLDVDADGLKVVGLPSLFKINDVAVGATVTAANLDTLTDGSNADSLHVHASAEATEAPKVENTKNTATDTVAVGDPVYINGSDTVGKALANDDTKSRVIGVIRTGAGAAPQSVQFVSLGTCAGVLSGATPGTPYYLQTAGGIGTSLPGAANRVIQVGWALTASDLWVELKDYGKKAA